MCEPGKDGLEKKQWTYFKSRNTLGDKLLLSNTGTGRSMTMHDFYHQTVPSNLRSMFRLTTDVHNYRTRGPFLESPVNFSSPKSNIQIEIKRIRARVLASKLLHFVSLTDSFIMLDAKLLNPRSLMQTETAYRAR